MNIEALCAAPPEVLPRSPSQMPLGYPVVSSAPCRLKSIELQATAPSPTPTRAEGHIALMPGCRPAGHRAFAPADTSRTPRWAADRAPPRPCAPVRAEENPASYRAADLAALRALTHADCAEEIATCPCASCPRRRVRRNTSPWHRAENFAPPAAKRAEGCSETAPGPAAPTQGFERSRALDAAMKKPFARVSQGALRTSLPRPGAPNCLPRG